MRELQAVLCSDGVVRNIDATTPIPDKWRPIVPVEESAPSISEDEVPGPIDPLEEEDDVGDEDSFEDDPFSADDDPEALDADDADVGF